MKLTTVGDENKIEIGEDPEKLIESYDDISKRMIAVYNLIGYVVEDESVGGRSIFVYKGDNGHFYLGLKYKSRYIIIDENFNVVKNRNLTYWYSVDLSRVTYNIFAAIVNTEERKIEEENK